MAWFGSNENHVTLTKGIQSFLRSVGMDEYYETFVTKGFDLETDLQFLTSTDLDELGITVPEHRRVLLAAGRPNSFSNNYIHCVRGMCNYGQWIFKSITIITLRQLITSDVVSETTQVIP